MLAAPFDMVTRRGINAINARLSSISTRKLAGPRPSGGCTMLLDDATPADGVTVPSGATRMVLAVVGAAKRPKRKSAIRLTVIGSATVAAAVPFDVVVLPGSACAAPGIAASEAQAISHARWDLNFMGKVQQGGGHTR